MRRGVVAVLLAFALTGCHRPAPADHTASPPPAPVAASSQPQRATPTSAHDLSADEAMGGHTLARHVGKTDNELIERLRREPQISSASTYTGRETAERVVGAALESGGRSFENWRQRNGRRPNFVLHYSSADAIGRTVSRGRTRSTPCRYALVVLRWDDRRDRFYVLTSYPEEHR